MPQEKVAPTKYQGERDTYAVDFFKTQMADAAFLDNPQLDNLMIIVYALATELWAERERSRVVESLLAQGKKVTYQSIQQYVPSPEEKAEWIAEQDEMTKRIFGVLARDTSAARKFSEPRFKDRNDYNE